MLFAISVIFFGEDSVKVFGPFFFSFVFLFLSFLYSLYILDNSPLSDASFANIFYQSVAFLFILLPRSVAEHVFLILVKYSLSIISFMDSALVLCLKSHPHTQVHIDFLLHYLPVVV